MLSEQYLGMLVAFSSRLLPHGHNTAATGPGIVCVCRPGRNREEPLAISAPISPESKSPKRLQKTVL